MNNIKNKIKPMKRFEYCYIRHVTGYADVSELYFSKGTPKHIKNGEQVFSKVLEELGDDGWEMVGCGNTDENIHTIYFKRVKD